jgi:hypothetical protein
MDTLALENIQRKFCKYLYFVKHAHYPVQSYPHTELLAEFDMCSLKVRRDYLIVLFLYKIINGFTFSPLTLGQLTYNTYTNV